jgi:hypothetical protein
MELLICGENMNNIQVMKTIITNFESKIRIQVERKMIIWGQMHSRNNRTTKKILL